MILFNLIRIIIRKKLKLTIFCNIMLRNYKVIFIIWFYIKKIWIIFFMIFWSSINQFLNNWIIPCFFLLFLSSHISCFWNIFLTFWLLVRIMWLKILFLFIVIKRYNISCFYKILFKFIQDFVFMCRLFLRTHLKKLFGSLISNWLWLIWLPLMIFQLFIS